MHKPGEKRDFLPDFISKLSDLKDLEIYIEVGYGKDMAFSEKDYQGGSSKVKIVSHDEVYKQDIVIILRAPNEEDIIKMKEGSVLISMLHYGTRPVRNDLLKKKKIICYSMDSMVDDKNERMVVNYWGTSMAGASVAFNKLKETMADFYSENRKPINVSLIGFGRVGVNALQAFNQLSYREFYDRKVLGLVVKVLSRSITRDTDALIPILKETDILVDASKRRDPSKIIVPNDLIAYMPNHAIILDLTADPYDDKAKPMQQKGIEGIPTGSLQKYIIESDDDLYNTIPNGVKKSNRRTVVSCNAWPGVHPKESMKVYGEQMYPFMKVLLEKNSQSLSIKSDNIYERALIRSSLEFYLKYLSKKDASS
ncbi:alanine dehydrogenase [Wukongibacter baidiensis]|uniref:alanine dehydrogenase n=1 Tax=Wukongibacter baidiensis TaxID=1723361 RepID=UPI003D7F4021